MTSDLICIDEAHSRPAMSASYSATLFVAGKSNLMAFSMSSVWLGEVSMMPAPLPDWPDAPSTNKVQYWGGRSLGGCGSGVVLSGVVVACEKDVSEMKSARI